jgi:pyrroloquinoline quinone biosynthesis protein D
MSEPVRIDPEARPRLRRGVRLAESEAHGGWVLLGPERVFKADAIAAEIIKRCNGEATFTEIIDDLAKTYAAPRDKIADDVTALISGLVEKMMLEM